MQTMGFVISGKENERRRALLPNDLKHIKNKSNLYFEKGYGEILGYSDQTYLDAGVRVVSREEAYLHKIICNPKAPEPSERKLFSKGQTFFGWIHAIQGSSVTDFLLDYKMTGIAWEDMFEGGLHLFWRNNEIAGEAAILHSFTHIGRLPNECRAALIGRGNCARGAFRILCQLGANVVVYDRKTVDSLREDIGQFDVVVNAVFWDVFRSDHLIYKEDLSKMKIGSMIVDISCDPGMGIETSRDTSIENPVYEVEGIIHYAVDHTPALFFRSATESISAVVCRYVDDIIEERDSPVLEKATIIKNGVIMDERISLFQKR